MKIILRDDDPNYYTTVDEIQLAYGKYLGVVPVTFGVVPFVHPSHFIAISTASEGSELFDEVYQNEKKMSVEEYDSYSSRTKGVGGNISVVKLMKTLISSEMVEVAQHGVNHRFYRASPEMHVDNITLSSIREGNEYLEKVFGCKVKAFIPPYNFIDYGSLKLLNYLGLNLLYSGGVTFGSFIEKSKYKMEMAFKNPDFVYKKYIKKQLLSLLKYKNIFVSRGCTFQYSSDVRVEDYLKFIKSQESSGCKSLSIATHYSTLSSDSVYRKKYHRLISSLLDMGHEFVRFSDTLGTG